MPKDWTTISQFTVTPDSTRIAVGSFSIDEGDDTIWIEVQRIGGDNSWPWSYGIAGWRTDFGFELGTIKVYTELAGEVHKLGVGRAPRSRSGSIIYEPRGYNLAWIKKGYPLTLSIACCSGVTAGAAVPVSGSIAFPVAGSNFVFDQGTQLAQLEIT